MSLILKSYPVSLNKGSPLIIPIFANFVDILAPRENDALFCAIIWIDLLIEILREVYIFEVIIDFEAIFMHI